MFAQNYELMKAAVINSFGEPDIFEIQQMPEPEIGEGDILLRVEGGSVNPIDWKQRRGKHKFIMGSKFPIVLGYDVSGEVVKCGSGVARFKVGDKVCGVLNNKYGGGLGELAKGAEHGFVKIPDGADALQYGVLPLAAKTALQSLRDRVKITKGQKILIIAAAGGVGHYAVQIAHIYGAEVHAVSSQRHKEFLTQLAPVHHIDYTRHDIFKLQERFDIIYDTIGIYPFPKCKHLLKPGGVHINTLPRPKILLYKFMSLFTSGKRVKTHLMKHKSDDLELLVKWVDEGKLKLCIDKEFTVGDVGNAQRYMEEGHTQGKILIRYTW